MSKVTGNVNNKEQLLVKRGNILLCCCEQRKAATVINRWDRYYVRMRTNKPCFPQKIDFHQILQFYNFIILQFYNFTFSSKKMRRVAATGCNL